MIISEEETDRKITELAQKLYEQNGGGNLYKADSRFVRLYEAEAMELLEDKEEEEDEEEEEEEEEEDEEDEEEWDEDEVEEDEVEEDEDEEDEEEEEEEPAQEVRK